MVICEFKVATCESNWLAEVTLLLNDELSDEFTLSSWLSMLLNEAATVCACEISAWRAEMEVGDVATLWKSANKVLNWPSKPVSPVESVALEVAPLVAPEP